MSKHLKRLNAPDNWPMKKKENKYIAKPMPGPHPLENSLTISLMLKGLLSYAKTTKEVKGILHNGDILIDKFVRKDHRFPVGIMDVVEIPKTKETFRILLNNRGKFIVKKVSKNHNNLKLLKIIGKKSLKGNKTQLNFFDGKNLIIGKDDYKVNDTVIFNLEKKKIEKVLKFEKGALIYITKGKFVGETGILEEIKSFGDSQGDTIRLKQKDQGFETLKDYAFVIDKDTV